MDQEVGISLCMIVRDEEAMLPACLASTSPYVREIIVVDTGSSDRTVELAEANGAAVFTAEWAGDFSTARNVALDHATMPWILVLDADEELRVSDAGSFWRGLRNEEVEGYLCRVINYLSESVDDRELGVTLRLFRNRPESRFRGALHEQIAPSILGRDPLAHFDQGAFEIHHHGYLPSLIESKHKKKRNLAIALRSAEEYPEDGFVLFNLGNEYLRAEQWTEAKRVLDQAWEHVVLGSYWAPKLAKARAIARLQLGNFEDALDELDRMIPQFRAFTDLVFLRALACRGVGRKEEAIGALHQVIVMGPAPAPPYTGVEERLAGDKAEFALGQIYLEIGRLQDAVTHFERSFMATRSWPEPLRALLAVLLETADLTQLRAYLQKTAEAIGPKGNEMVAEALMDLRRYDVALELLDAPGKVLGSHGHRMRAVVLAKLSRFDEAISEDLRVRRDTDDYRAALVHRAYCLYAKGDRRGGGRLARSTSDPNFRRDVARLFFEEAREVLEEGHRRFPDSQAIDAALQNLRRLSDEA